MIVYAICKRKQTLKKGKANKQGRRERKKKDEEKAAIANTIRMIDICCVS